MPNKTLLKSLAIALAVVWASNNVDQVKKLVGPGAWYDIT